MEMSYPQRCVPTFGFGKLATMLINYYIYVRIMDQSKYEHACAAAGCIRKGQVMFLQ